MIRHALAVGVLLVAAAGPSAAGPGPVDTAIDQGPDGEVLAKAEHDFAEGTGHRNDGDTARDWFRASARGYDLLWRRGHQNPGLAVNRSRARRLAGDLPGAIEALHDGLAVAPYDRPLQVELEDARSAVAYPLDGELAARCRPKPLRTIGSRMSSAEAYAVAGVLWLLVCVAGTRFVMTRAPWWLAFAGLWLVLLLAFGGLWQQDQRRRGRIESRPLLIVKDDVMPRRGNSESYPARLESKLPRGVEVRELGRRGGWVQVELAGGDIGWLPERSAIRVGGV